MPFVYVMNRANGHMKVGFSHEPAKRLLQVNGTIEVLAAWQHPEARQIEHAAHKLLQAERQDGEWFAVDRYAAFDAVARAMREIDGPSPVMESLPAEPLGVTLAGEEDPEGYAHRLGYARPIRSVSAEAQKGWMVRSGVHPHDIYADGSGGSMPSWEAALKDFREGDTLLIWSEDVVRPATLPLELQGIAAQKGGKLAFADGSLL